MLNKFFIYLIKGYQLVISPWLGSNCRFHPTCSQYAIQCFQEFNIFKAIYMTVRRISKCHPFHPGGVDHVR